MTKTGTMPSQGDIVLVPIPFTDLSSPKRRHPVPDNINQSPFTRVDKQWLFI